MSSSPTYRLVSRASWQPEPWRNGGGITHTLHSSGPLPDFHWRVSAALVKSDGPFSNFAGIDRKIALLEGAGFHLQRTDRPSPSHEVAVTSIGETYAFHGDDAWTCSLVDGGVLDLNLMVRRGRARGELACVYLGGQDIAPEPACAPHAQHALFLALADTSHVEVDGDALTLARFDLLHCVAQTQVNFGRTRAMWMRIDVWDNQVS